MNRRDFLVSAVTATLLRAEPEPPRTFVYKKADGCEIKADVFGIPAVSHKPVAVWIHGGALIFGSRKLSPNARMLRSLLAGGFTVISIDYRLAPETKLPAIVEDVQDAFRWIRKQADTLHIEPERVAVCGGSAGGYLTLMTGFSVNPRPKALVSFWGYGDIAGRWYSRPDPFYLKQAAVPRDEAVAAVGKLPLSEPPENNNRSQFYLYCRQQGIWPKEVAGRDPDTEDRWFDSYCPIRNITREYPPTMLVHGTEDTDVPHEQSTAMAERLRQVGVEQQFVSVPGGGHGINNISSDEQDRIYREAAAFLMKRV
ncbi:MAG: alpha/beta hydrolase [Acidobacteriia bacterium]|nr:alpha/beta hydrolase [Terriglobia bacterium]